MSTAYDSDVFPSTSGYVFNSINGSNSSSESDQDTLLKLETRKQSEEALKKESSAATSKPANHPRNKKSQNKKSSSVSARSCSISFGVEE